MQEDLFVQHYFNGYMLYFSLSRKLRKQACMYSVMSTGIFAHVRRMATSPAAKPSGLRSSLPIVNILITNFKSSHSFPFQTPYTQQVPQEVVPAQDTLFRSYPISQVDIPIVYTTSAAWS